MERLTVRKYDYVLLKKDGQTRTPMELSGQEIRMVMERLAELEDAIEQGKLVEVVHCGECEYRSKYGECKNALGEPEVALSDYCSGGSRKPQLICLTEDCPYQQGNPCEAAEGCGGFEGAE